MQYILEFKFDEDSSSIYLQNYGNNKLKIGIKTNENFINVLSMQI